MLIKDLVEAGLSEKEAKIYLALLELEMAKANEIAKKSGVNRATTYIILDELIEKGFVSISADKTVKRFIPTSPEALLRKIEEKTKDYQRKSSDLKEVLPELLALHKDTKHKPVIKVFEGKDGLISTFEDSLKSKEKLMRVFSSASNHLETLSDYFPQYIKKRIDLGIKMRGIHPFNKATKEFLKKTPRGFDQILLVPEDRFKFLADIAIYDNKIGYMVSKSYYSIIIENKDIAEDMKRIFDLAWEEAKRLNKKINI